MSNIGNAKPDLPRPSPHRVGLRLISETALDAVIIMRSDGVVDDWNDRAAGIFGWSRDEAVSRRWSGGLCDRLSATTAEFGSGLVLEAACRAWERKRSAALGTEAPGRRVVGHAAWAAHLMPPRREPIRSKDNRKLTRLEARPAACRNQRVVLYPSRPGLIPVQGGLPSHGFDPPSHRHPRR
jgi:PAS domain S-box-containing protein